MSEPISPRSFHEAEGVEDWRVLFSGACAHFRTETFTASVALAAAIGRLADAAGRHPNVDLRPSAVTVCLPPEGFGRQRAGDVALARQISAAARELNVPAEPSAVQAVQISIDALAIETVMPFWRAVLGYEQVGDEDLLDPQSRGPAVWFQQMDAPRPQRNRIHIDISVPHDQAEARIAAAIAAGGRLVSDRNAPAGWLLADPEGNEIDVATWMGRE
ncbi:hypothetical protein FKR81_30365 [Lentzea tibetensis]|uniref:Putative pterin-4-alpha-carbinolamine dehydratase n=1 Tax=Lentzea tibetensis TaxID=2591470 RepID=A0A563EMY6_9PSEU|nr:VOC family protein [Lentzea tibetensis]TWP47974.1 hypothetical protein FKR81_30365 [Lentzea tibetensis]